MDKCANRWYYIFKYINPLHGIMFCYWLTTIDFDNVSIITVNNEQWQNKCISDNVHIYGHVR